MDSKEDIVVRKLPVVLIIHNKMMIESDAKTLYKAIKKFNFIGINSTSCFYSLKNYHITVYDKKILNI